VRTVLELSRDPLQNGFGSPKRTSPTWKTHSTEEHMCIARAAVFQKCWQFIVAKPLGKKFLVILGNEELVPWK
jgi:hypothetical protein